MRFFSIFLLSLTLFTCSQTDLQEATYQTERVEYISKNILGFENLFGEGLKSQEDKEVFGILHFPETEDLEKKYQAIVDSPGSSNRRAQPITYLEQMRQAGIRDFTMHPLD